MTKESDFYEKMRNLATPESKWPVIDRSNQNSSDKSGPSSSSSGANSSSQQPAPQPNNEFKSSNMDCKPNRKVIVKTLTLANGTAAGTYQLPADFGKEYKKLIGYYFIATSLANLTTTQVKLGLADSSRTILDPVLIDYHTVSTSVPIDRRFNKEECIELISGSVNVNVVISAALTVGLEIQMIGLVERPI